MSVLETRLDHLVIVTAVLEEGIDFCERMFGTRLLKGGEHVRVGTHNCLLKLGEGTYLEVIAINPAANAVDCRRWFGMDCPEQRMRAAAGPYLATFVARTNDISHAVEMFPQLGPVRDMQRGVLEWKITIPDDGALVEGGAVPTVIQWPDGIHPTQNMPESDCHLAQLDVFHPEPDRLRSIWARIGLHESEKLTVHLANGDSPYLVASLVTPRGIVELR